MISGMEDLTESQANSIEWAIHRIMNSFILIVKILEKMNSSWFQIATSMEKWSLKTCTMTLFPFFFLFHWSPDGQFGYLCNLTRYFAFNWTYKWNNECNNIWVKWRNQLHEWMILCGMLVMDGNGIHAIQAIAFSLWLWQAATWCSQNENFKRFFFCFFCFVYSFLVNMHIGPTDRTRRKTQRKFEKKIMKILTINASEIKKKKISNDKRKTRQ